MVSFVASVCLSTRKSCQIHDCSKLGIVRNWVEHCTIAKSEKLKENIKLGNIIQILTTAANN